jgi:hypothetical protein
MSLSQLNASYDAREDRIVLRVNTTSAQEYRLSLTRRITLQLVAFAQQQLVDQLARDHGPQAARAIADFRQDVAQHRTNFNVAFKAAQSYPLGLEPKLVVSFQGLLAPRPELKLVLKEGVVLTLPVDEAMLRSFCLLLERTLDLALWRGATELTAGPVPAVPSRASLH